MNVKHILERGFAVGQEEVHALAGDRRRADGRGRPLGDPEQMHAKLLRQVGQTSRVQAGNDQRVSWVDRRDVHERDTQVVFKENAAGRAVVDDGAEDTFGRGCHSGSLQHASWLCQSNGRAENMSIFLR